MHRVAIIAYDGVSLFELSIPLEGCSAQSVGPAWSGGARRLSAPESAGLGV
jgi:hypothetical protein